MACAFYGGVNADPAIRLFLDRLHQISGRSSVNRHSVEFREASPSASIGLINKDLRCAGGARRKSDQRADRPGARNQNGAAHDNPGGVNGVHRDSGRFEQRALFVAHSVGKLHDILFRHGCKFAHSAPMPCKAHQASRCTELPETTPNIVVPRLHQMRKNRDAIPRPRGGYRGPDTRYGCREFVPEDDWDFGSVHRMRFYRQHDGPGDILMKISAANSTLQDLQYYLVRQRFLWR